MLQAYQDIIYAQDTYTIFTPYDEAHVQGASYDLHIGEKIYISRADEKVSKIITLSHGEEIIIPPNSIFMFQTMEKVKLPAEYAAKLSLRMGLVRRGMLMPSQTQADPGYKNFLFGFLYNLSDQPVRLSCGEHIVSLELYKLQSKTSFSYRGKYQNYSFRDFVSNNVRASLDTITKEIEISKGKLDSSSRWINYLSIVIAVVTLWVALLGIGQPLYFNSHFNDKVDKLSKENKNIKNELKNTIERLAEIERRLQNIK